MAASRSFHGMVVHDKAPEPEVKFSEEELRIKLTDAEYCVTQDRGTERKGVGKHLHPKDDGTFVCKVCELELFKSDKKFDSGSGWPSFSDVISYKNVVLIHDPDLAERHRIEVKCAKCGAHLGHVFEDAPKQDTGLRYCINSLATNFISDK